MTTATELGGWISARSGKWHRTEDPEPCFTRDGTALCGITFRPLNVTWHGEMPHCRPVSICKHCTSRDAGMSER